LLFILLKFSKNSYFQKKGKLAGYMAQTIDNTNASAKTIYCISGIGSDERVFRRLRIEGYVLQHIQWAAFEPTDTMESYARKLLPQIKEEAPLLLGVSFGGMLAVEITRQIPVQLAILVSSSKNNKEMPFYYRWYGRLGLYRVISPRLLKWHNWFSNVVFSIKSHEEKQLLKAIMRDINPLFLRWTVKAITTWTNNAVPAHVFHIHGKADKLLPGRYVKPDVWIEKAGHFMIHNRAGEISTLINERLGLRSAAGTHRK
jgi:pimeloyl-ACP methyl ester carboxylesterase